MHRRPLWLAWPRHPAVALRRTTGHGEQHVHAAALRRQHGDRDRAARGGRPPDAHRGRALGRRRAVQGTSTIRSDPIDSQLLTHILC